MDTLDRFLGSVPKGVTPAQTQDLAMLTQALSGSGMTPQQFTGAATQVNAMNAPPAAPAPAPGQGLPKSQDPADPGNVSTAQQQVVQAAMQPTPATDPYGSAPPPEAIPTPPSAEQFQQGLQMNKDKVEAFQGLLLSASLTSIADGKQKDFLESKWAPAMAFSQEQMTSILQEQAYNLGYKDPEMLTHLNMGNIQGLADYSMMGYLKSIGAWKGSQEDEQRLTNIFNQVNALPAYTQAAMRSATQAWMKENSAYYNSVANGLQVVNSDKYQQGSLRLKEDEIQIARSELENKVKLTDAQIRQGWSQINQRQTELGITQTDKMNEAKYRARVLELQEASQKDQALATARQIMGDKALSDQNLLMSYEGILRDVSTKLMSAQDVLKDEAMKGVGPNGERTPKAVQAEKDVQYWQGKFDELSLKRSTAMESIINGKQTHMERTINAWIEIRRVQGEQPWDKSRNDPRIKTGVDVVTNHLVTADGTIFRPSRPGGAYTTGQATLVQGWIMDNVETMKKFGIPSQAQYIAKFAKSNLGDPNLQYENFKAMAEKALWLEAERAKRQQGKPSK